ncbi:MAG: hypothetical protein H7Z12_19950 [Rhodospirillaceae bacterium]|nr:hypothetical protein [Rhodospirillales bacterium]
MRTSTVTLREAKEAWPTNRAWWRNGDAAPELEQLYISGESYLDLAIRYNTNPRDIYRRVTELGLTKKHPRGRGGHHMRKKKADGPPGYPKRKRCLKCRNEFTSHGPHNHLCTECRSTNNCAGTDMETAYG